MDAQDITFRMRTVHKHLPRVHTELGVGNRTAALMRARGAS